jgi:hypothetical protein
MSKLDERLEKLREQERLINLDKRKVEFLQHILKSAEDYNHKSFVDVKADVIGMLAEFTNKAIQTIEGGAPVVVAPVAPAPAFQAETPVAPAKKPAEDRMGPGEKLSFAMDNRHLAGKAVSVSNDKNITIKGKVVGLDAPFVLIQTETGPTIKVPLDKVSLN